MIKLKFIGADNKPEEMEIHPGIIKSYTFLSNSLVIEFKRSEKTLGLNKKSQKPVSKDFIAWTWTKNVNDILNYSEVVLYLKSLKLDGTGKITIEPIIENLNTQHSLF